jgi:hypothetical protein
MSAVALLLAFAAAQAAPQAAPPSKLPQTVAEASDFARTATSAEVEAFVAACVAASPKLARLSLATSTKGRDVPLVLVADPPLASLAAARDGGKLPVLVFANIHAGEVEGKEAVQQLLREFASGDHADLLAKLAIAFVPNLNPDGNDAFDRKNRPDQNGPVEGVGLRANGQGLDLNRDYVKLESPEIRGLVAAVAELDAALVMDLHTTDGSYHGYELTYASPQHPATDQAFLAFGRHRFLPALRDAMAADHFATFDYGDFADGAAPEKGWFTFDHRARYGTNYFGLQNRLTLLSEAYSHEPFDVRIAATHAFVLHALAFAAGHADELRSMRRNADAEGAALAASGAVVPRRGAIAVTRAKEAVLVGECRSEKDPVTGLERVIDTGATHAVEMAVHVTFDGVEPAPLPAAGFAIDSATPELEALLRRHLLRCERLAKATTAAGTQFRIAARTESPRPFQGHRLVETEGAPEAWQGELPAGTLFVPSAQPLARLALLLLDARSDDGLATWGVIAASPDDPTRFVVRAIAKLGG